MGLLNQITETLNPSQIDDFIASINKHGGLAKPNRFSLIMTPPSQSLLNLDIEGHAISALTGQFGLGDLINDPRDVAMLCESLSFPGRQIQTFEQADLKTSRKVPTTYFNEDITLAFHITEDYWIKKYFDRWQGLVINQDDHLLNYENEYVTDVFIQQLDSKNVPIFGVKLLNAYPIGVQSIPLDNTQENSKSVLQVTLTYEDFQNQGAITSMVSSVRDTVLNSVNNLSNSVKKLL